MNNQKMFYELPKPKRKKYFVIVQEDTTLDDTPCAVSNCKTNQNDVEENVYECFCCGQWFCIDHTDKDGLCQACTKLPKGVQDDIIKFKDGLNQ